ncbi:hypothetical protein B0H14DRAFT_2645707 [Mycena olivaceomarginata]|nr:hypothetical protein B0H14DRAFT_2645707 [Mycena olivaceomarginata]
MLELNSGSMWIQWEYLLSISEETAHCMDNSVAYLERKNDKLIIKDPAGFREGDIVQLGFAVVAYRTYVEDNIPHYVCKLVTHTLTLLDNSVTKAVYAKRNARMAAIKLQSIDKAHNKRVRDDEDSSDEEVGKARERFNTSDPLMYV